MLIEQDKCVGCGACSAKCPRQAITMLADAEGFLYPRIDNNRCNGCKVCENVCPVINIEEIQIERHNLECYAGFLRNENLLRQSSSGGAATALAHTVIRYGGIVFGAAYTYDFKAAEFLSCSTEKETENIRGTKYIQSRKEGIYKEIENQCMRDRMVLVFGLPCEIAAIKSFLGREYDNLYTCELICHGPTSEKVQQHFVEDLERKFRSRMTEYNVRYKKEGWTPLYVQARFINGRRYERKLDRTDFFHALAIFLRPSCYHCEFKGDKRVADISIGDFWGDIEKMAFYNKNGVSAIMIHTEKGRKLIRAVNEMIVYPVEYCMIHEGNPRIDTCEKENEKRKRFSKIFESRRLSTACIMTRGLRKSARNIFWRFYKN